MNSPFRYPPLLRDAKKLYRQFCPVPKSPWTAGHIDDISTVNLVPPEKLISFFTKCMNQLCRLKGNNIGDYLEFGVFNGNSIGSAYLAREALKISSMRHFGFDAFEGLPAGSENEDNGVWKTGFYACPYEKMRECLEKRKVPPDNITWVKGWYNETLNDNTTKQFNLGNFGIVFVDCDTYSSSKTVLDFIAPLIKKPMIICFDDWKLNDLDVAGKGEYKSFNEFVEDNPHLKIKSIKSYNRKSRSFLITPKVGN